MIQAANSPPADPVFRPMSAETMKIPDPIIDPTTIVVESNKLSARTKPADSVSPVIEAAIGVFTSDIRPLLMRYFGLASLLPLQGIRGHVRRDSRHRSNLESRPANQLPRDTLPLRA